MERVLFEQPTRPPTYSHTHTEHTHRATGAVHSVLVVSCQPGMRGIVHAQVLKGNRAKGRSIHSIFCFLEKEMIDFAWLFYLQRYAQ